MLPQISGYIKYFENGGKNMSILIKEIGCCINTMKFGKRLKEN